MTDRPLDQVDEDPDDGLELDPTPDTPGAESGEFVDYDQDPTVGDPGDGDVDLVDDDDDGEAS